MKTTFLSSLTLAAALLATPSQATGVALATLTNVSTKIETVEVQNDGTLAMKTRQYGTLEKKISVATLDFFSMGNFSLQNAEIKTTYHPIVCMMAVDPLTLGRLTISEYGIIGGDAQGFTGKTRFIMNESHCSLHSSTAPVTEEDRQRAQELISTLRILANEFYFERFGDK